MHSLRDSLRDSLSSQLTTRWQQRAPARGAAHSEPGRAELKRSARTSGEGESGLVPSAMRRAATPGLNARAQTMCGGTR
jgi:hypothetical protein